MPEEQQPPHDGTKYRLRRIAPESAQSSRGTADGSGRNTDSARGGTARDPASVVNPADVQAVEEIIQRTVDLVTASSSRAPASNPNATPNELHKEIQELKELHHRSRGQIETSLAEAEKLRADLAALEAKHIQFVEANMAFTQWRDQVEKERVSWADANAKFARRHEENKAAKANLQAKYKAAIDDLETLKAKYENAKREIARFNGTSPTTPTIHHPNSSSSSGPGLSPSSSTMERRDPQGMIRRSEREVVRDRDQRPPKDRSIRGVERDRAYQPPSFHPAQQMEQSVLRERLTSDMFTLSQKILEERAHRAEEGRQMAERRIFELEGQIARSRTSTGGGSDHDRAGSNEAIGDGGGHWRDGSVSGGPHYQRPSHHDDRHHGRRDSNGSNSSWTHHSPHTQSPHLGLVSQTPISATSHHTAPPQHPHYRDRDPSRPSRGAVNEWDRDRDLERERARDRMDMGSMNGDHERDYRRYSPPPPSASSTHRHSQHQPPHHRSHTGSQSYYSPPQPQGPQHPLPPPHSASSSRPHHYQQDHDPRPRIPPRPDWDYEDRSRQPKIPKRPDADEEMYAQHSPPSAHPAQERTRDYDYSVDDPYSRPRRLSPPPPAHPSRSPLLTQPPKSNGNMVGIRNDPHSRGAYMVRDDEDAIMAS